MQEVIAFCQNQREEVRVLGDTIGALSAARGSHQTNYIAVENHPTDSRIKLNYENICQTLSTRMGTGGNNVPLVLEKQEGVVYSASKSSYFTHANKDKAAALVATDWKDPPIVAINSC